MNTSGNTSESTTPTMACYRLGKQYLVVGIVCLTFFLALDVGSLCLVYWNVDGKIRHPVLAALFFGVFWSCMVLLALWLIVAYFRERLFVTPDSITQYGIIGKTTINIPDILQIAWRRFPKGGSVIVRSHFSRIKINLANFTGDEQLQLIAYLRDNVHSELQDDWTCFIEARLQPARGRTPKISRAAATILGLLAFLCAGVLGHAWLAGQCVECLIPGLIYALAGVWCLWRILNWRDRISD